jgi:hypothetical protein
MLITQVLLVEWLWRLELWLAMTAADELVCNPALHLGVIPFCLAIPPKSGQSRSLSSGFNIVARSLVLKYNEP